MRPDSGTPSWRRLPDPPRGCGGPERTDWPYQVTVGLGDTAIVVATNDPEVADRLSPWSIEGVDGLPDYSLDVHPRGPGMRGPRPLPVLFHGCAALVRSSDGQRVAGALLRTLNSFMRPPGQDQIRFNLMPVVNDGRAVLAPPGWVAFVPDRTLRRHHLEAVYTEWSTVDTEAGTVLIDPPLGSEEEPYEVPITGWRLPYPMPGADFPSPGHAVAEAMQRVAGTTPENVTTTLHGVVRLVERLHPRPAPYQEVLEALVTSFDSGDHSGAATRT